MANLTFPDFLGFMGVGCIITTYFLSQIGRMEIRQPAYPAINAIGAVLILASLMQNFNAASFVIELFWLAISITGLIMALRRK